MRLISPIVLRQYWLTLHRPPDGQRRRIQQRNRRTLANRHRFTVVAVRLAVVTAQLATGTCHGPTICRALPCQLRCGHRWSPGKFSRHGRQMQYAFHRVCNGDPFTASASPFAFSVCTSRVIFGVFQAGRPAADRSADYQNDDRAGKMQFFGRFTNHRVGCALTLHSSSNSGN